MSSSDLTVTYLDQAKAKRGQMLQIKHFLNAYLISLWAARKVFLGMVCDILEYVFYRTWVEK